MGNFYIKENGQSEIDLTQHLPSLNYLDGIFTPNFINTYQDNTGTDGSKLISTAVGPGSFKARFFMPADNYAMHTLLRHELYQYFGQRDLIRIRTSDDASKCFYARPASFELNSLEQGNNDFQFEIPFEVPSGYMYSVQRSDELTDEGMSLGMNLQAKNYTYKHSENEFIIYNASDMLIDPYFQRHDLKIMITTNGPLTIKNTTNNTSWSYKDQLNNNTKLVIDGVMTYKDKINDSKNTDFGFIKLNKGENNIVVSGATQHELTFSFPFIYLA